MANAVIVTLLSVLFTNSVAGYAKECVNGPQFWCQSFENAQDCGAIRHCTDTVWNNDAKYALVDSSTACQWCQRILTNLHKGIQGLTDNENVVVSTFLSGCKLLPSDDFASKCTHVVQNYGASLTTLIKNKRYATLCHLMSICSIENPPTAMGQKRCTWGPSYWCSSLSNSQECNSIDHCATQIWSQQAIEKSENDNLCQYCEDIVGKLRSFLRNNQTEINVEKWLTDACSMLETKEIVDKCVQAVTLYADEILLLTKNQIDPGVICHLGDMCEGATITTRVPTIVPVESDVSATEESKILCHVIVRATHDLHVNEKKSSSEIQTFLRHDCQGLSTSELREKCEDLVIRYGIEIYDHLVTNMELSKVCDYIGDFADPYAIQLLPHVHCDLCTFVLSTTKYMLDAKQSQDEILLYLDAQLCSRFDENLKTNCQYMLEFRGADLIEKIQNDKRPILLCTHFQVCVKEVLDGTSPIGRDDMVAFLNESICDQLGPFVDSCIAIMRRDSTRLLKTLVDNLDGDVLCQMFGVCPMDSSFIDDLSTKDDKNTCKRCLNDLTRRKHIAEKLLNSSMEFVHHLCAQLPQKDDCMKVVDHSMANIVQFIQSLSPQDICVELKLCNESSVNTIELIPITSTDNVISQELMVYVKNEICARLGPMSNLCHQVIDNEGANALALLSKDIDPHQVCSVLDVCPKSNAFNHCSDKCECCVEKMENYQVQLSTFLEGMLTMANVICEHNVDSEECREVADGFQANIAEMMEYFNPKQICQVLSHCTAIPFECKTDRNRCQCCQNHFDLRQTNFQLTNDEIRATLHPLCTDEDCRSRIQSNHEQTKTHIDQLNSLTLCQRFGFCSSALSHKSIPYLADLLSLASEVYFDDLCSQFGDSQPICDQLIGSSQSSRYVKVYMAFLKDNLTLINGDFHEQKSETCEQCKSAFRTSKNFWNNALVSVHDILLRTCDSCSSKDQCQNYYNQRFENLTSYLDQMYPEDLCESIHLCSITLPKACSTCLESLQQRKEAVRQAVDRLAGYFDDLCQQYADKQCQIYVKEVHDSIGNSIEEMEIEQTCATIGFCATDQIDNEMNFEQYDKYLEEEIEMNICSVLGPFQTLCKAVLRGDTNQIQTLKINYDLQDFLQIGEEVTDGLIKTDEEDQYNRDKCQCCINRIIRKKRLARFVGDQIYLSLIRSCDRCPVRQQCRQYYRKLQVQFDARIHRICPKHVCIHLGYCNKSSSEEPAETQQLDQSNSTCILCEYAMNILSNLIHQQSTEEDIEQSLEQICRQMPEILRNRCEEYVDSYGPSIIAILLREFDLTTMCYKLNLCTSQMKIDITHLTQANSGSCGICDYIATYLQFALQRDSTDKSLQHALSVVCGHLSEEQNSKCQTIIQLFSPHIRQLEIGSKKNFCEKLTICQTPMIELIPAIPWKEGSSNDENADSTPKCILCRYVISYLDAVLKSNKSQAAIDDALVKVCTILPDKEGAECHEFIESYGPVLVELITKMVDADAICRYLGMCDDSFVIPAVEVSAHTPYTCMICQYIGNRMKYFFGLDQTTNEVSASLTQACDLFVLPDLRAECQSFLKRHALYFSRTISDKTETKAACQNIGVCKEKYQISSSSTSTVSSSVKYGKCIFGMKYWCTSRANAELCNAVELCERELWSKNDPLIY